jgi:hypothetical protein
MPFSSSLPYGVSFGDGVSKGDEEVIRRVSSKLSLLFPIMPISYQDFALIYLS